MKALKCKTLGASVMYIVYNVYGDKCVSVQGSIHKDNGREESMVKEYMIIVEPCSE